MEQQIEMYYMIYGDRSMRCVGINFGCADDTKLRDLKHMRLGLPETVELTKNDELGQFRLEAKTIRMSRDEIQKIFLDLAKKQGWVARRMVQDRVVPHDCEYGSDL